LGWRWDLVAQTIDALAELDEEFAGFVANQYNQRWIAADVLNQTLDESFALHIDLAAARAGDDQVRTLLLLVAEYGSAKAWRAYAP
jgi:4-carboxymuconolactone decarboxylase